MRRRPFSPRKNKYGVAPISERTVNGVAFASKLEARRWMVLLQLEKIGQIADLRRQVRFDWFEAAEANGRRVVRKRWYIADFVYIENGLRIVEDCKGCRTAEYLHKRKLMRQLFDIDIRET